MALLECPECKQEVAERDYFCIECGYPRSGMSANKSPARPDRSFEATHPRLATAAKNKRLEAAAAAKQERRAEAAEKKLRAAAAKQDQARDQDPVKIYDSKAPTENIADKVMTWGTAISIPVVLYLLYRVANWLLKALTGLELNPAELF